MKAINLRRVCLALLVVFLMGTSGCRQVRMWTGIGLVIENAEDGTPESVIQSIFEAALLDSESKGWNLYRKHIHPEKMKTVIQKEEWKRDRWPRLRRNVSHYVLDPSLASFQVKNEEERENGRFIIHIENAKGQVPTPCALRKDGRNRWKLWSCSL